MTDQELLELAAKAAGLTNLSYCPAWKCMAEFDIDMQGGYFKWDTYWNPLKDDSHALQLAVNLQLGINNDEGYSPNNCRWATASEQRKNQRPMHIVRAAAEIGKVIP